MIIVAISPSYLNHIKAESEDYNFILQGYGDINQAMARGSNPEVRGLRATNPSEICGFAVVLDQLPANTKKLLEFMKICDMISVGGKFRKRFVLGLQDTNGVNALVRSGNFKNLDVYVCKFEIMTDLFIRREIFGLLLSAYYKPYARDQETTASFKKLKVPEGLRYTPLFSPADMRSVEEVRVRATLEETIIEDLHLDWLKGVSSFHYDLRKFLILRKFSNVYMEDADLEKQINAMSDPRQRIHSLMLYEYAKGVV